MTPQKIFPTRYDREDGQVAAIQLSTGQWVLRCVLGRAFFLRKQQENQEAEWILPVERSENSEIYHTQEEALALLPTVAAHRILRGK